MEDDNKEKLIAQWDELLAKHCAEIGEHFDSVRIFVTKYEGNGNTFRGTKSNGNYYAQLGQIKIWLEQELQLAKNETEE